VQCTENQMAGQSGLYGDLGRLGVAYFPNEDHVGILADDGPESFGKGKSDLARCSSAG